MKHPPNKGQVKNLHQTSISGPADASVIGANCPGMQLKPRGREKKTMEKYY
jgi:hypothetical protein